MGRSGSSFVTHVPALTSRRVAVYSPSEVVTVEPSAWWVMPVTGQLNNCAQPALAARSIQVLMAVSLCSTPELASNNPM
ncbi:Uncharacterised protein [Enterobacter cloacae]|nr:Uncharacterised protein [Enterobacter cloacae]